MYSLSFNDCIILLTSTLHRKIYHGTDTSVTLIGKLWTKPTRLLHLFKKAIGMITWTTQNSWLYVISELQNRLFLASCTYGDRYLNKKVDIFWFLYLWIEVNMSNHSNLVMLAGRIFNGVKSLRLLVLGWEVVATPWPQSSYLAGNLLHIGYKVLQLLPTEIENTFLCYFVSTFSLEVIGWAGTLKTRNLICHFFNEHFL